jgi:hypothetical protein
MMWRCDPVVCLVVSLCEDYAGFYMKTMYCCVKTMVSIYLCLVVSKLYVLLYKYDVSPILEAPPSGEAAKTGIIYKNEYIPWLTEEYMGMWLGAWEGRIPSIFLSYI